MKKNLIKYLADTRGISELELRREMEGAIRETFQNPNLTAEQMRMQNEIPRAGEIPTVEEFVAYMATQIKNFQ